MSDETVVPELSIIIVTYNSAQVIKNCLASIEAEAAQGTSVETLVVDNGSTDGTPELVRAGFPAVRLITGQGNVGFARGNNIGFGLARGRYLLMLNADTEIHPGGLRALVAFAEAHPEAGFVAPHLVNPDGSLQHSTFRFPDFHQAFYGYFEKQVPMDSVANGRYLPSEYEHARRIEHALGAAVLIRRAAYEQIGGMDEKYALYFEETDWCFRCLRAGWQVWYTPEATIMHLGAHSTRSDPERSSVLFARSQSYYWRKNYGWLKYAGLKIVTLLGLTYWLVRSLWGLARGKITGEKFVKRAVSYGKILVA